MGWDGTVWGTSGETTSAITKVGEGLWAGMGLFSLDSTAEGLLLPKLPRDLKRAQVWLSCTRDIHFTSLPKDVGYEFIIPHNHGHPL